MSSIDVLDEYDVLSIVERRFGLSISDGFLHLTFRNGRWGDGFPVASIPLSELKEALNDSPA